ncbi:hypothetical protein AMS68_007647 [Peltaster fructicola]|uniref:Uncharacterized protein n=1 Tax=Peltaster fructicola TaxID=286661 RepID=A0A6H0Y6A3_9PEZI|nr:hypothetical protein AMS68_007647 [Peltaster fructicola]
MLVFAEFGEFSQTKYPTRRNFRRGLGKLTHHEVRIHILPKFKLDSRFGPHELSTIRLSTNHIHTVLQAHTMADEHALKRTHQGTRLG